LLTLIVIPVVYDLLDRRPDAHYVERGHRSSETVVDNDVLIQGATP
jgi:HAE1 family hydrophobic/amphiphilic exporter-1